MYHHAYIHCMHELQDDIVISVAWSHAEDAEVKRLLKQSAKGSRKADKRARPDEVSAAEYALPRVQLLSLIHI